jgi:hypothetical protein
VKLRPAGMEMPSTPEFTAITNQPDRFKLTGGQCSDCRIRSQTSLDDLSGINMLTTIGDLFSNCHIGFLSGGFGQSGCAITEP